MGTNSNIEWTHHTFNPWRGCTKVSAGCAHCYAETLSKRNPHALGVWGPSGQRVVAAESYWKHPLKWNEAAKAAGERHRVFCASLADVFEGDDTMPEASRQPVAQARFRLFNLIQQTRNLDWLLLTKRPQNIGWDTSTLGIEQLSNVWLGTSVESAAVLHRVDELRRVPSAVRFLSCEPLIAQLGDVNLNGIHWVIVGGESGHGARPFNLSWARNIVKQCKSASVACFVKQLGANPVDAVSSFEPEELGTIPVKLHDAKGGDLNEWPEDLRVREFPEVA